MAMDLTHPSYRPGPHPDLTVAARRQAVAAAKGRLRAARDFAARNPRMAPPSDLDPRDCAEALRVAQERLQEVL